MYQDNYEKKLRKRLGEGFIAGLVILALVFLLWVIDYFFNLQIF